MVVTVTASPGAMKSRKLAPSTSPSVLRVAVQVFEADGRLRQRTEVEVPETVLRSGLHPAFGLISELEARSVLADSAKPVELSDRDAIRPFDSAEESSR